MEERRPIMPIVKEVTRRLKLNNYSIRRIESDLKQAGISDISRGKLIRLFYTSEKNNQDFLNSVDDTIEAVLNLLGITSKDLYQSLLDQYRGNTTEMSRFIQDPDAMPYLKEAYNKYKADKLEKQIQELQDQIKKLRE